MKIRFQRDIPILMSLASCYGCQCGILYCLGLYQEVWMKNLHFSASQGSWISGLAMTAFRIPSPVIEFLIQWFKIPPYVQLGCAGLLIAAGLLALSFCTSFPSVLAAAVFGIGLGCSVTLLSVYTSTCFFFKDHQIPLFFSIISAGAGVAMIVIALTFEWLERSIGWQSAFRYHTLNCLPFLLALIVLCPKINSKLSDNQQKRQNASKNAEELQKSTFEREESLTQFKGVEQNENKVVENQAEHLDSRLYKNRNSWKSVLSNVNFLILLLSWILAGGSFKATMVHEPQRIVKLGYSIKNSAGSLAINGGVQFVSRLTVGVLASSNIVSIVRLSQIGKLSLAIATFISVIYTDLAVQHGFMSILGAFGGAINTTDAILVKDCFQEGRNIALSIFIFVDSTSGLIATVAAGYFVDFLDSYQIVFIIYGVCFAVAASLTILMELATKKNKSAPRAASESNV